MARKRGSLTEQEWLTSVVPEPMLEYLGRSAGARKLRLFAVACSRRVWPGLCPEAQAAIEVAERHAEGLAPRRELDRVAGQSYLCTSPSPYSAALNAAHDVARIVSFNRAHPGGEMESPRDFHLWHEQDPNEQAAQCVLLREVFGNPFRPAPFDPLWITSGGGAVSRLAQAIYEERGYDDLPILADALEEAGCDAVEVLEHCRGPGPHARGCWVLDGLLNKR
jgi:hypothetical protein